mgnify:CR=1 FL=1|tara:strand:- start:79 stop:639 length:561 start_codon:yes stop_codon:yes gene_type:complete
MSETNQNTKKRFLRKSGRTLVLKLRDESFDVKSLEDLTGLQESATTQNQAVFLTFDTKDNALEALKNLKKNNKEQLSVKFAHYKVFFKLEGLTKSTEYDKVKTAHTQWVESNTQGEVLYYKLYRKNDEYLGCGDLTVDTKASIDALLSEEQHKTFKLDDTLSGTYYRYNRNGKPQTQEHEASQANE